MITKKEDLINTYIENDHGELRDLYLAKCEEFGFLSNSRRKPMAMKNCNAVYFGITRSDEALSYSAIWSFADNGCKKLTLSDLKPRTRTKYEKVTESIWELRNEFERGELYGKIGDTYESISSTQCLAASLAVGICYRLVEKEIDWREELHEWQRSQKKVIQPVLNFVISEFAESNQDKFLEMCRVTLRANGEIE